jgi:hypothetical protein
MKKLILIQILVVVFLTFESCATATLRLNNNNTLEATKKIMENYLVIRRICSFYTWEGLNLYTDVFQNEIFNVNINYNRIKKAFKELYEFKLPDEYETALKQNLKRNGYDENILQQFFIIDCIFQYLLFEKFFSDWEKFWDEVDNYVFSYVLELAWYNDFKVFDDDDGHIEITNEKHLKNYLKLRKIFNSKDINFVNNYFDKYLIYIKEYLDYLINLELD